MRKITRDVCKAFIAGKKKAVGNTFTDGECLFLHGNLIARKCIDGYSVTLAGWPTVTTRERLNGLCRLLGLGPKFSQMRHAQYFESTQIEPTEWITLKVPVDPKTLPSLGYTPRVV